MRLYAIGDLLVESDLPLVELPPAVGRADSVLRVLARPPDVDIAAWVFDSKLDEGRTWIACAKHPDGYLIRFPDLADFTVSSDGRAIAVFAATETPADTLRHLFLDQVFPLSLSLRGELALHAGAIATPDGAVAFAGDTGDGKSTLTASFAQAGFPPLSDDCLVVREDGDRVLAVPSYPGLRLWPDAIASLSIDDGRAVAHYTEKQRVVIANGSADRRAVPLRRLYVLMPADEVAAVSIAPLSRRDAVVELLKHAYRIEPGDRRAAATELERADRVCGACAISRLAYPRAFASLPRVRRAVLEDLARG